MFAAFVSYERRIFLHRGCSSSHNKTISDGGITVDFSIIKVHTSN